MLALVFPVLILAGSAPDPPVLSFVEESAAAGLTFVHATNVAVQKERHRMTPGVAVADFDGDGFLDVFVPGGTGQNARLFLNDGDGTFTDRTAAWGIDLVASEGSSAVAGDVDGDGDVDLHVGVLNGPNALLLNTNGGGFLEAAEAAGVARVDGMHFDIFGAALGDVDLDGDLDLVTGQWTLTTTSDGNRLFLNDGSGHFTEATTAMGAYDAPTRARSFVPALVDLNGDRYPELTVVADFGSSLYHANLGPSAPAPLVVLTDTGTGTDENGMGSAFADYDNDGDLDWFITSIHDDDGTVEGNWGASGNRLYRNDGDHQFTDVTDLAGVRAGDWGWGAVFGDFDHDGFVDLTMTNGFLLPSGSNPDPTFETDRCRFWLHGGDPDASPVYNEVFVGINHTASGKGLIAFDAENDGDLDLIVTTNQGPLEFFRNQLDPDPTTWIELDFEPPPGNAPAGVGARVEVTVGATTYHRVVLGAPSYLSQGPRRVHVAFPTTPVIDAITVTWPDGTVKTLSSVTPGRLLTMRPTDIDGDAHIGVGDLLVVLGAWGDCPPRGACPPDVNDDGIVGVGDLLATLGAWGDCAGPCPADVNGDGGVEVGDLLAILGSWSACPPVEPCSADVNGDGVVDVSDVLLLLAGWG